jgi:hypothetical protein
MVIGGKESGSDMQIAVIQVYVGVLIPLMTPREVV